MGAALSTDPTITRLLDRWPAIWLRDNCRCTGCRDPRNGQKLFGITDLPARPVVVGAVRDGADVLVDFEPAHRGVYPVAWLDAVEHPAGDGRTERGKLLWQAADLDGRLPTARWTDYLDSPAERLRVLQAVRQLGFALVHDVPTRPRTVLDVAATFGHVRTTNYGELFDVRVEPDPNNLAFTSARITPHTDNPTATRSRRSSSCTAWRTPPTAGTAAWSTGSTPQRCCAPSSRTRSRSSAAPRCRSGSSTTARCCSPNAR